MYTAKISLKKRTNLPKDTDDEFWYGDADDLIGLIGVLKKNGQVMGGNNPMIEKDGVISAFVNIADADALEEKYHNSYTKKEITTLGKDRVTFEILGEDPASSDTCQCCNNQERGYLILHTNYLSQESPIDCGNCELPVPLYKLPKTRGDEYFDILMWQKDFQSYDSLQMHGVGEKFALSQLSQVDSEFSQYGLEICAGITKVCGIPCYYYLYTHYGKSLAEEKQRKCPSCQGEWLLETPIRSLFNFKCDSCHLLSNIAYDTDGELEDE